MGAFVRVILSSQTMTFQLNSKKLFLTYPRCDVDPESLVLFLRAKNHYAGCCVARETHEDGGLHLHAFVCFSEPYRTRDAHAFDLVDVVGAVHHPNIQSARSAADVLAYVRKHGDYIDDGDLPGPGKQKWSDALQASTKQEFLASVKSISARDYVLQFDRLSAFARHHYEGRAGKSIQSTYSSFVLPAGLRDWKLQYFDRPRPDRPKALWLVSPSRYGKTQWAKSLDPHAVYWCGTINLDDFYDGCSTVIFDDFDWPKFRDFCKPWLGSQHHFVATDKYRAKRSLEWGGLTIFLSNYLIGEVETSRNLLSWLDANVVQIFLNKPLF